jgi:tRNA (cmo5U34)-methyltransferase
LLMPICGFLKNFGLQVNNMATTETERFANVLGSEYNLFEKAVPHHDEFQDKVGETIKDYAATLQSDVISVVEGGCGTGLTTIRVLGADKRIKVIGIDNEEKTIIQAKTILGDFVDRVTLEQEDLLEALRKLPDKSVDIYTSVWVIHNLPPEYRAKLFPEIARVLKKGGLFINGDKYARDDESAYKQDFENQINAFDEFDKIERPDLKKEWTEHYRQDEKIKISESEQIKILEGLGFKDVKVQYRKGMEAIISAISD